jgi:hypothetical protein
VIFLGGHAKEGLKSGHGCLAPVKTKDKFIEVILQIFGINAMMSAIEPGFEVGVYSVPTARSSVPQFSQESVVVRYDCRAI